MIFSFILSESKIYFIKTYVKHIVIIKCSLKNLVARLTTDTQQGRATNKLIKYLLNNLLSG